MGSLKYAHVDSFADQCYFRPACILFLLQGVFEPMEIFYHLVNILNAAVMLFNPFRPENVLFIHYKPRIAVAILDL